MTAYLFKSGELEALLADISIERNALSPISRVGYDAPGLFLTEEKLKLRDSAAFRTAASIISSPQIRISVVKGGGSLGVEHFNLLGRIEGESARWTALINNENTTAAIYFDDTQGLIEWFNDTFAVKTDIPMNNLLASDMTLEEWVILAHTVDAFRRVHMESMLLYRPKREYSIAADDYIASLNVSLESGDIRWLLPAFFAVTPGLAGLKPNLSPEVLQAAEAFGLISHTRDSETNAGFFTFSAEGMTIGLEFATSWMYGVGFDAAVLNDDGGRCVPVCFLAPTSLGNHLFMADRNETGAWSIRHQALMHTELDKSLADWFGKVVDHAIDIGKKEPVEVPKTIEAVEQSKSIVSPDAADSSKPSESPGLVEQPVKAEQVKPVELPKPAQTSAPRFCIKCGNKIMPGIRFCSKCGNKVA